MPQVIHNGGWKLEGLRLMVMINLNNINASFPVQTDWVYSKHGLLMCDVKCGEERCSAKETVP